MNIQAPNYQEGYARMGNIIQRGVADIGTAIDAGIQKKKEKEAYDILMARLADFDKAKSDFADELAETMVGESPKYIEQSKEYVKSIDDKKQFYAMIRSYKMQKDAFEQNKGIYKVRPQFGVEFEKYVKQNEPYVKQKQTADEEAKKLQEQQQVFGAAQRATGVGPATTITPPGQQPMTMPGEAAPQTTLEPPASFTEADISPNRPQNEGDFNRNFAENLGRLPEEKELEMAQKTFGGGFETQKPMTEYEKKYLDLQDRKLEQEKNANVLKNADAKKEDYDKVFQGAIDNKNKSFALSARYDGLIKTIKQAIKNSKTGIVERKTMDLLNKAGYEGETSIDGLISSLNDFEAKGADIDNDISIYEQQIKELQNTPRPTQRGTHQEASRKIIERNFPQTLKQLSSMPGFATLDANTPAVMGGLTNKTINIGRPDVQEKIKQALMKGMSIEEIAQQLKEAAMGR